MKNKLAIFDLDGTLYDTRKVNYLSYNKALSEFGAKIDYKFFSEFCNGKKYTTFLPGILDDEYIEKVHLIKKIYYKDYLYEAVENKHLFNIIEKIKDDYNIALVTTASQQNTNDILHSFNRKDVFDLIVTQDEVKNPKPDPEGFLIAMRHFNTEKEDTIIFEDSEAGVQAAKKTGANVYIVKGFA